MHNFIEQAKALFFKEHFQATYEQKRDELLRFYSEDIARQKVTFELEKEWEIIQTTLKEETKLIFHEGKKRLTSDEFEQMRKEIRLVGEKCNFEASSQLAQDLGSIQWSHSFLEIILKIAKKLAREKEYKASISLFHLLTVLAPNICDFWVGLGISFQESGQVSEAVNVYEIAKELTEKKHPLPLLYLSECLKQQGKQSKAKETFELSISLIQKDEKFQNYASEASRIRNLIY